MLAVEQRSHDDVEAHALALFGGTGDEQVRGVCQVEHLHFLGDGVADGDRKFVFAVAERVVVEEVAQRHYALLFVGDLDTHGVGQGDHANAAGLEAQGYVFLKLLDFRNLHAGGGSDLVEGDGGADDSLYVFHVDAVGLEGLANLVVVLGEFDAAHFALAGGMLAEQFDAGEFVPGKALGGVHTVVDGFEFLHLGLQGIVFYNLYVDVAGGGFFGGAGR